MVQVKSSVLIEATPEEVFPYEIEPDLIVKWSLAVKDCRLLTPGPIVEGSELYMKAALLGIAVDLKLRFVKLEPPHQAILEVISGPVYFKEHITVEAEGDLTRATQDFMFTVKGWYRLLGPIVPMAFKRATKKSSLLLKEHVERSK